MSIKLNLSSLNLSQLELKQELNDAEKQKLKELGITSEEDLKSFKEAMEKVGAEGRTERNIIMQNIEPIINAMKQKLGAGKEAEVGAAVMRAFTAVNAKTNPNLQDLEDALNHELSELQGVDSNPEAGEAQEEINYIIKLFIEGNSSKYNAEQLLKDIEGVEIDTENYDTANDRVISFTYNGKTYTISCDKQAAGDTLDNVTVDTISKDDYNALVTQFPEAEQYFKAAVTVDGKAETYALDTSKLPADVNPKTIAGLQTYLTNKADGAGEDEGVGAAQEALQDFIAEYADNAMALTKEEFENLQSLLRDAQILSSFSQANNGSTLAFTFNNINYIFFTNAITSESGDSGSTGGNATTVTIDSTRVEELRNLFGDDINSAITAGEEDGQYILDTAKLDELKAKQYTFTPAQMAAFVDSVLDDIKDSCEELFMSKGGTKEQFEVFWANVVKDAIIDKFGSAGKVSYKEIEAEAKSQIEAKFAPPATGTIDKNTAISEYSITSDEFDKFVTIGVLTQAEDGKYVFNQEKAWAVLGFKDGDRSEVRKAVVNDLESFVLEITSNGQSTSFYNALSAEEKEVISKYVIEVGGKFRVNIEALKADFGDDFESIFHLHSVITHKDEGVSNGYFHLLPSVLKYADFIDAAGSGKDKQTAAFLAYGLESGSYTNIAQDIRDLKSLGFEVNAQYRDNSKTQIELIVTKDGKSYKIICGKNITDNVKTGLWTELGIKPSQIKPAGTYDVEDPTMPNITPSTTPTTPTPGDIFSSYFTGKFSTYEQLLSTIKTAVNACGHNFDMSNFHLQAVQNKDGSWTVRFSYDMGDDGEPGATVTLPASASEELKNAEDIDVSPYTDGKDSQAGLDTLSGKSYTTWADLEIALQNAGLTQGVAFEVTGEVKKGKIIS